MPVRASVTLELEVGVIPNHLGKSGFLKEIYSVITIGRVEIFWTEASRGPIDVRRVLSRIIIEEVTYVDLHSHTHTQRWSSEQKMD